jgi:hypothetical protein
MTDDKWIGWICKETAVALFKILYRHLSGATEDTHEEIWDRDIPNMKQEW